MRFLYGGTAADVTTLETGRAVAGAVATAWFTRDGDNDRASDLKTLAGAPTDEVTSDANAMTLFYGPDGYDGPLWLDYGLGWRTLVRPTQMMRPALAMGDVTTAGAEWDLSIDGDPVAGYTLDVVAPEPVAGPVGPMPSLEMGTVVTQGSTWDLSIGGDPEVGYTLDVVAPEPVAGPAGPAAPLQPLDEYPAAVGQYNNPGTAATAARSDHVHSADVLPRRFDFPGWAPPNRGNAAGYSVGYLAAVINNALITMNGGSGTGNQFIEWDFEADEGMWSFAIVYRKMTTFGIADIALDGVSLGTIDMYNSATSNNQYAYLGPVPVSRGRHVLRATSIGKNPASANYTLGFHGVSGFREEAL